MNAAQPPPEGVATWGQIAISVAFIGLGLLARRRFRSGWGDAGARMRSQGTWGVTVARLGFASMPLTWAASAITSSLICLRLFIETDADAFAFLAVGSAISILGCLTWAIKEFNRPRTRRRPDWVDDFERDMGPLRR